MRARSFSLTMLLAVIWSVGAQQSPEPAATVMRPVPRDDSSAADRIAWIRANSGDDAVRSVFERLIADAQMVDELFPLQELALHATADPQTRRSMSVRLATVFRTARLLGRAETLYEAAFESSGGTDLESLFALAQLLLERGDLDSADAMARRIVLTEDADYSLKRRAYTLSARIAFERGQGETALEMLGTLASLADDGSDADHVEVETILLMWQVLLALGEDTAAEEAKQLMDRLFPSSVAAIAEAGDSRRLTSAGLPSTLLFALAAPEATGGDLTPAAVAGPDTSGRGQPRLSAVQVGSFLDADNAEHLSRDLQNLGLEARVETLSREGESLHQVLVAIADGTTEGAARVFAVLSENGFDGFLVY